MHAKLVGVWEEDYLTLHAELNWLKIDVRQLGRQELHCILALCAPNQMYEEMFYTPRYFHPTKGNNYRQI